MPFFICLYLLLWLKTFKTRLFFMPINQDQFWDSNAKIWVTYPINANIAIISVIFNKKYVVVKAMRRSSGISKILLMKKLKSKVYVSFRIRLYLKANLRLFVCSTIVSREILRYKVDLSIKA